MDHGQRTKEFSRIFPKRTFPLRGACYDALSIDYYPLVNIPIGLSGVKICLGVVSYVRNELSIPAHHNRLSRSRRHGLFDTADLIGRRER
jgi:hypothetical protein